MDIKNEYLYYHSSPDGITVKTFTDFSVFALETSLIEDGKILPLAKQLFVNKARVVATNIPAWYTQIPLKKRGTVNEIIQCFNDNFIYVPIIHPLVAGISKVSIVDEENCVLEVVGTLINSTTINVLHEYNPLAPRFIIETEAELEKAIDKLMNAIADNSDNYALIIPLRDAINVYNERKYALEFGREINYMKNLKDK